MTTSRRFILRSARNTPAALSAGQVSFVARSVGYGVSLTCIWAALYDAGREWMYWVAPGLHCLLAPWVGQWMARHSSRPGRVERQLLMAGHAFGGAWTALIGFNLLPSVVILSTLTMHGMAAGGRRQVFIGLLVHVSGIALGVLCFGLAWRPQTSLPVMLACVPGILLPPLALSSLANSVINKLHAQREQLRTMANLDALSGLANRHHWEERVRQTFARARHKDAVATVVMIDLDHFKRINDEYGHAAGDDVIRGFGTLLKACLRQGDVAGRYGGEEFGILLQDASLVEALRIVERIQGEMTRVRWVGGMTVTASYGLSQYHQQLVSADAWLAEADRRLYAAKHAGRDRFCVGANERRAEDVLADGSSLPPPAGAAASPQPDRRAAVGPVPAEAPMER